MIIVRKIWDNRIIIFGILYIILILGILIQIFLLDNKLQTAKKKRSDLEYNHYEISNSKQKYTYQELKRHIDVVKQELTLLEEEIVKQEQQKQDIISQRIEAMSNEKEIYLTFDDGPSYLTEKNLDILKKYDVKATFFIINKDDKYNNLIKRMKDEGHTIGLHSYSHDYREVYQSVDAYFEDLKKLQDKVFKLTKEKSMIIRFPGGSSNTISRFNRNIMTTLTKETVNRGYRYFDWNISSGDASGVSTARFIRNCTRNRDKKSIMILMHDSPDKKTTSAGLEEVIKYYLKEDYVFKNITMDSPMFAHKVFN